jgi:hypothetical protein
MKVPIGGRVGFDNEIWKGDVEAQAVHSNESKPALLLMYAKTVERIAEVRSMEADLNQYFLVVQ